MVRLMTDIPDEKLEAGMLGVIVDIFDIPDKAYEVEFCHESGETISEIALKANQIELVKQV